MGIVGRAKTKEPEVHTAWSNYYNRERHIFLTRQGALMEKSA